MTTGILFFGMRNRFVLAKVVYEATIVRLFSTQGGEWRGGDSHIKGTWVLVVSPCRGSKGVLVSRKVFSLKRSTARAFAIPSSY